ncbi:MAG: PAC2 family protein [Acidimicrobiia bacterium]
MLEVQRWPELRDTLLVVALSGWVDAGTAGAASAAFTIEQLDGARSFARMPLADHVDLQQTRPTIHLDDGVTRSIRWPELEMVAGRADRDVVVLRGPEPSLRWPAILSELVEAGARLDVREVVTLGGMPAAVSHRQVTAVLATASTRELADEIGALRADYEGPTGAQTALAVAFADQGVPAVGLWAQVPHYLAGATAPTAVRALADRLGRLGDIRLDAGALDDQCDAWLGKVEESLAERPEVAELVEQIEAAHAELPPGDLPTGEELVGEIERFLREEP